MVKAVLEAPSSHNWSLSFQDMLVGENPLDVERLWDKMYQGTIYTGRRGLVIHAMGAVDLALWDIAGKALAGRSLSYWVDHAVRMLFRTQCASPLSSLQDTERQVQQIMESVMELKYTAVKLQLVYDNVYTDADIIRLVRRLVRL